MLIINIFKSFGAILRQKFGRIVESHVLFPASALLFTAIIWLTTINVMRIERETTETAARAYVRELAETYEAQVLRALREVDQGLKLIQYDVQQRGNLTNSLSALEAQKLLPSAYLFSISIYNSEGVLVASYGRPLLGVTSTALRN